MAALQNLQSRLVGERQLHFNAGRFVREQITRSWLLTLWLLILAYITVRYTIGQLIASPVISAIVLVIWIVTVAMTVINEITRNHTAVSLWLKNNLYSSITNTLLSLLLVLLVLAGIRGFIGYAFIRASFSTNPDVAHATLDQFADPGANWGAVIDNMRNLMVFRFPRDGTWRVWAVLVLLAVLGIPSAVVYRGERYRRSPVRTSLTILWLLTPIIIFFLLRGIGTSGPIPKLNPEIVWGGLLLTLIVSVFGILASFPLGLLLALGRRSQIRGIPSWLTWTAAAALTAYELLNNTPEGLATARSFTGRIFAFWPLLILLVAYLFQRYFKGNVVAVFSTIYIESVRGVPFITVLFMSIILFPIFLPPGMEIIGTWRVMAATAMFAAAYLAENVRGGLQSIPKGQYEAADALGLNAFQKYRLIILPQALRAVIPAIVGQFIGLFKDTTLVAIVGLVDLLGAANLISAQPDWLGVRTEPYIFLALIYFVGSAVMAGYSRRLEAQLGVGER
ncbi:MAG: amino acid ABC transporter permease [Anaerolineae bacterium]